MVSAALKLGALFGASMFGGGIIASAVSVYGLDYFEPRWGRGISFQIGTYLAAGFALIGAFGSGLAFTLNRAMQPLLNPVLVILSGALLLALSLILASVGASLLKPFGLYGVAIWSFAASFGFGLGLVRLSLRESESAT